MDDEAVMTELRRRATEEFSDPDATFVVDGSTFPKKGKQWCGRLAARQQGHEVRFYFVTELITMLLEAREEKELTRLKWQLSRLDLLILDELGYVPASKAGAELLFDEIAMTHERLSVIVTTNLPFEN